MRILLVDDHVLFRDGLASLIRSQPDMTVVGEAGTVCEAEKLIRAVQPELVIMDISLPDGSGLECAQAALAIQSHLKIVFLTVHDDDERLFAGIRAGALGYILKNARSAELLQMLRGVSQGEAAISPTLARRILAEFSRLQPDRSTTASALTNTMMTAREMEIVQELARGATNQQIAERLFISENTVKNHVRNVLSKLQLHSRRDVAEYLRQRGIATPVLDPWRSLAR